MARAPLVSLRDVRLQDGPLPLFDGVDLAIEPGQHACLVGRNGAGKSTLMKLVMGLIEADRGERALQAGARFAYVPQEPAIVGPTLRDHATSGGADPWAGIDQTIVAKAASESADAIASFLTTAPVPEAKPDAGSKTRTAQADTGKKR